MFNFKYIENVDEEHFSISVMKGNELYITFI